MYTLLIWNIALSNKKIMLCSSFGLKSSHSRKSKQPEGESNSWWHQDNFQGE